jgi:general secretion pathway protein A
MYEEYYRFGQSPFTLSPDPRFLYRSASHEEALTVLLQAVRRHEGFIVLAGDIGTGKTTLCRALLQQLDVNTFTSLILNPFLSVEELLREILLDFGVVSREAVRSGRISAASKHELISTLHEFLLSLIALRGNAVLIIDEAQHLSPDVLEQIRVLSNLETNEAKLLQIVLVGQLNLLDVLAEPQMRQLDQRISLRAMLKPLTRGEVEAYIAHRLWVAKPADAVTFDAEAVDTVNEFSGGVPRVINLLCDRALMLGANARVNVITPPLIEEAADSIAWTTSESEPLSLWGISAPRWLIAAAAAILLAVGIFVFAPIERLVDISAPVVPPAPALELPAPLRPIPPPAIPVLPSDAASAPFP